MTTTNLLSTFFAQLKATYLRRFKSFRSKNNFLVQLALDILIKHNVITHYKNYTFRNITIYLNQNSKKGTTFWNNINFYYKVANKQYITYNQLLLLTKYNKNIHFYILTTQGVLHHTDCIQKKISGYLFIKLD